MQYETHSRSIFKTVSWRVLATIITTSLVFIFTRKIEIALFVGGTEAICKMVFYFFHERVWNKLRFGKREIKPFVLWFTGLSGAGKSVLADKIYEYLNRKGLRVERLDGDAVRSVFPKTGFSKEERNNHIKKAGFLASLLEKNGVIVVSSFVSPYKEARDFVRNQCNNFIEVYVSAPVDVCERRDPKGLYKKVRNGEINNFTGIDDPYEVPESADIVVDTAQLSINESLNKVKNCIKKHLN
ncbi:MAG: adenylyl-sulfate kinase [Candidatus Omnitrophota bacterium]|nr:MAG: adenylyl-sulfate kinase [Candidatus Omnitrophota bacterium]